MNEKDFEDMLYSKAIEKDIILTEDKLSKFELYKNLLVEWNEKINLTAITDDEGIIVKHFIDSLECTKVIDDNEKNIIDIGTGAGFPGLVLAIYYPDKKFILLDALNKRIMFLDEVKNKLNLENVEIIHGRAEEYIRMSNKFNMFDACVSRAVASLPILLEYVSPYVKVNGKCIIMKGSNYKEEIDVSKNALKVLNLELQKEYAYSYSYDNEEYSRVILVINKIGNTPEKYPRNYGKIKKKPL